MLAEREHSAPLAAEGSHLAALHFPQVNQSGLRQRADQLYSTAIAGGNHGRGQGLLGYVEIWHGGHCRGAL